MFNPIPTNIIGIYKFRCCYSSSAYLIYDSSIALSYLYERRLSYAVISRIAGTSIIDAKENKSIKVQILKI